MEADRDEIIRKAILEKLSPGIDFFTADDILAVAGVTEQALAEIYSSIHVPPPPAKMRNKKIFAEKLQAI